MRHVKAPARHDHHGRSSGAGHRRCRAHQGNRPVPCPPGALAVELAGTPLCAYEGGVPLAQVQGTTRPLRDALHITTDGMLRS